MIIISSTTVTTEFIQFSGQQSIRASIILDGIEDRYPIDCDGDRAAKEIVFG
jgi:hypothetical protein